MIITRTPYRISFFGGGTDYPAWFKEHGGAVLGTSIDKYCYITARYLPPFFEHKYRIVYSQTEDVRRLEDIRHGAVREIIRASGIYDGLEVHHDGDLPARSGMGTSSSFAVGMLNAIHALKGEDKAQLDLGKEAITVEQEILKENVGCQDQLLAAVGGFNLIRFDGYISVERLTIPGELGKYLMLIFTGQSRYATEVVETQLHNMGKHIPEMKELQAMVLPALAAVRSGSWIEFGKMLGESWEIKRHLSERISNPYIDFLYKTSIANGALGGKILGAGGGGFLLLSVEPEKRKAVKDSLGNVLEVPFAFDSHGTQVIFKNGD